MTLTATARRGPPATLLLLRILVCALVWPVPCFAQGDSRTPDFGEEHSASLFRQQIRGAPRGRLLKVVRDPTMAWGPFVRSPGSIWVGRRAEPRRTNATELVEHDAAYVPLRVHQLRGPWGPDPVFTSLGNMVGYLRARHVVAWSSSGRVLWQSGDSFAEARFVQPHWGGGVLLADSKGRLFRLDHQGKTVWSASLGGPLRAPPLLLPGGASIFCVQPRGALVALGPDGKPTWDDPRAQCSQSPTLTPSGDLVVPGENVLRFYTSAGRLRRSVPVAGTLGPAHITEDGSVVVASSRGLLVGLCPQGRPRWLFPLGRTKRAAPVYPSPTGDLVTVSEEGYLLGIDRRGRLRWFFPVPSPAPTLWVRMDGAVLVLTPGYGLRLIGPPRAARSGKQGVLTLTP